MRIRAHHLLCLQGFQGYGYSRDFVANMARVVKEINSSPHLEIEIIDRCDVICSSCPHQEKGICRRNPDSDERTKEIDGYILRRLGLKAGVKVKVEDIFHLANERLKNSSDIERICGKCGWREKCLWFLSQKNTSEDKNSLHPPKEKLL